ncbi:hypothetical protein Pmar_PMAR016143 [Perkinsus marinus ATCC 50983]|uniref:Uncharacterized protein n=1 Tax=Perkinsus marinus (strain ATCC 50983 / TXsc) TaxID=423536 RepID=C5LZ56_PERM5|nr:hypothetical protein Pmar_PMAR016143 [Perkinsus marinus ATCC 50983]EEQ98065.1 hypothetical protein Pmar_PMAR016143 [Perkinsus marinus ATCC 50983]|eukprot:XP_002765348.1 hypothetical protein Pmar_PMAR016143 [Perkinsus marinus ATCC 50983]
MQFPRITLAVVLIATLLTETSAVRLQRKGKGGNVDEPKRKKGFFSKLLNKKK